MLFLEDWHLVYTIYFCSWFPSKHVWAYFFKWRFQEVLFSQSTCEMTSAQNDFSDRLELWLHCWPFLSIENVTWTKLEWLQSEMNELEGKRNPVIKFLQQSPLQNRWSEHYVALESWSYQAHSQWLTPIAPVQPRETLCVQHLLDEEAGYRHLAAKVNIARF